MNDNRSEACIELAWWPPAPDERIGEERAPELLAALKRIAGDAQQNSIQLGRDGVLRWRWG